MAEYASNGKGNLGVTLGAIGTGLSVLNGGLGNLGGIFGNHAPVNPENMPVNRYEAAQQARIAELETEVKLRDANFFTMGEMGKLRDYVDNRLERIEHEQCDQRVFNATTLAALNCTRGMVDQLMGLTKFVIPSTSICPPPTTSTAGA
jgi:hypothetical protein